MSFSRLSSDDAETQSPSGSESVLPLRGGGVTYPSSQSSIKKRPHMRSLPCRLHRSSGGHPRRRGFEAGNENLIRLRRPYLYLSMELIKCQYLSGMILRVSLCRARRILCLFRVRRRLRRGSHMILLCRAIARLCRDSWRFPKEGGGDDPARLQTIDSIPHFAGHS